MRPLAVEDHPVMTAATAARSRTRRLLDRAIRSKSIVHSRAVVGVARDPSGAPSRVCTVVPAGMLPPISPGTVLTHRVPIHTMSDVASDAASHRADGTVDAGPDDERRDGRRARRDRSRDLAIDSLLDLLSEGVPRPTAQQVAERSGVSLRSIFRIFDDVETLHTEAAGRQLERNRHLFVDVVATGSLVERAEIVIDLHLRLYESVAPVRRAALRGASESAALRRQLGLSRAWVRKEIERVFGEDLTRRDEEAGVAEGTTLAALDLAFSFEAWDQLTTAQALSRAEVRTVLVRTVTALLSS
jgi:AcrR family transcriptional regulator